MSLITLSNSRADNTNSNVRKEIFIISNINFSIINFFLNILLISSDSLSWRD